MAVSKLAAGSNTQVLTTTGGVPTWQAPVDNSASNELQNISGVLGQGNDAGGQNMVNLNSVSINTTSTSGALNVIGSQYVGFTVLTSTTPYSVQSDDYLIVGSTINNSVGNVILPDASVSLGRILILRSRSFGSFTAGGVRFVAASGDTIDGAATSPILAATDGSVYTMTIVAVGNNVWLTIDKSVQ